MFLNIKPKFYFDKPKESGGAIDEETLKEIESAEEESNPEEGETQEERIDRLEEEVETIRGAVGDTVEILNSIKEEAESEDLDVENFNVEYDGEEHTMESIQNRTERLKRIADALENKLSSLSDSGEAEVDITLPTPEEGGVDEEDLDELRDTSGEFSKEDVPTPEETGVEIEGEEGGADEDKEGESGPEEDTETGEKGEGNEEFDEQEALKKFAELYDEKKKIEDQKELDESQKAKIEKIRDALQGLLGELKNNTEMSRDEIMEEISKHSEELRAVEGGDLTDEEKSEIEETAHEALKEQREIIDIPPELVTNILTENEINGKLAPIVMEGIKDSNPEGAKQKGVELVQEMFEDLSEEQKQQLEQVLEEHGLEMKEFINKWKEDLAEDVVEAFYEDYREQVQHKIEDSIGTWDKFKAGWKDMGTKAIGIAGAGYLAGSAAEALGASGAGQWIARATGARTMMGSLKENKRQYEGREEDMMTHGPESESTLSPAMEQIKEEKRGEMAEEVFEDMIAGTSEESDELIGAVISQKLRDATAAEKIQKQMEEASGGDIELDPKKLRENLEDSSLHAKKERILYEYSQELKEEGFEEEAIKRKYETLAEQLDSMFLERRSLVEAGAERGASQEVLENLQAEFEGEIPEDVEQIDSRAVEIMKDIGIPLAAGGAGLAAAAEGMPGVGGGIAGFEAGYRAGKKWEQSAQKEHIAVKEAKKIQERAVDLLTLTGEGTALKQALENKSDEEIEDWIAELRGGLVNGVFDKRKLDSKKAGEWEKINKMFDEVIEASDVNTAFLESRVQNLVNSLEKQLEERQGLQEEVSEITREKTEEVTKENIEIPLETGKQFVVTTESGPLMYLENLNVDKDSNEIQYDIADSGETKKMSFDELKHNIEEQNWEFQEVAEDFDVEDIEDLGEGINEENIKETYSEDDFEIEGIVPMWVKSADNMEDLLNSEELHEDEKMLIEGIKANLDEGVFSDMSAENIRRNLESYNLDTEIQDKIAELIIKETELRKAAQEKMENLVEQLGDVQEKTVESGNEQVDRIIEETGGWRKIVGTIAGAAAGFLVGTAAARSAQAAEGAAAGKEQAPGGAEQPAGAGGGAEESGVTELEPTHIEGEVPADITIENPGEGTIWDNIEAIGEQNNIDLSDAEIQEAAVDVIEKNAEQGRIDVEVPEWSETVGPGDKLETLHDQMTQTELDQVNYDVEEFRDVLENAKEGQAGGGTGTSPASGATQPSAAAEPTPSSPTGGETPTIEAETPGGGTEAAEGAEAPTEVGTAEGSEATAQASETAGAAEGPPTVEEADVDLSEVEGEEPIDLTGEGEEVVAESTAEEGGAETETPSGEEATETGESTAEAETGTGPTKEVSGEEVVESEETPPEETSATEEEVGEVESSEVAEAETDSEFPSDIETVTQEAPTAQIAEMLDQEIPGVDTKYGDVTFGFGSDGEEVTNIEIPNGLDRGAPVEKGLDQYFGSFEDSPEGFAAKEDATRFVVFDSAYDKLESAIEDPDISLAGNEEKAKNMLTALEDEITSELRRLSDDVEIPEELKDKYDLDLSNYDTDEGSFDELDEALGET